MFKPYMKISSDNRYSIYIDNPENWGTSFFSDIYQKATDNFVEICEFLEQNINKENNDEIYKSSNIISFIGERGSGKSSIMTSFSNAIKSDIKQIINFNTANSNKKINVNFDNYFFEVLDSIDPSLFEEKDNILETVITKMFSKVKNFFDKKMSNDRNFNYEEKRTLLERFEKTFNALKSINKNISNYSDEELIEEISRLSYGSNLRNSFEELINEYLNFFCRDRNKEKKQKILVLVIDDFDLNIKHAFEMAELIRKYLFLPNVIILTALNFDDLFLLIQQSHTANLEISLRNKQINNSKIIDKTYRYLEKFIPYQRRLFLASVKDETKKLYLVFDDATERDYYTSVILNIVLTEISNMIDKLPIIGQNNSKLIDKLNVEISEYIYSTVPIKNKNELDSLKTNINNISNNFFNNYYQNIPKDIKEKIDNIINSTSSEIEKEIKRKMDFKLIKLIYLKTEVNFFPSFSNNSFDNLIPDSLRELKSLLFFLYDLKSVSINNLNSDLYRNNINELKNYFLNSWVIKNLTNENKEIFYSIISMDSENKYSLVKNKIYQHFFDNTNKIKSTNNSIVSMIYIFREVTKDENSIPLIFALKNYFSISNTLDLLEKRYLNIASYLNIFTIKKERELLLEKENLESLKFTVKPKEIYEKIKDVYKHFFDVKIDYKLQNILESNIYIDESKYKNPSKDIEMEVIEWLFLIFRFFTRDNSNYFKFRSQFNLFESFLNNILKDDPNSYFLETEEEKVFLLSDLLGIEFYIYNCDDLSKRVKPLFPKGLGIEDWTSYNNSMFNKIKNYKRTFMSAIPIYSLEILDRMLPNEKGIDSLKNNNSNNNSFIINFYNLLYSQFEYINMGYPEESFLRNPIISPFLKNLESKNQLFLEIFNFVFSKENAYLNTDK